MFSPVQVKLEVKSIFQEVLSISKFVQVGSTYNTGEVSSEETGLFVPFQAASTFTVLT